METKKRALTGLILTAVVLGAMLWLVVGNNQKAEQADSAAQDGTISLLSFSASELEQIRVTYQGQTLTLLYTEEEWMLEEDPAYHLDSSACNTMRTALSALNAKRQLTPQSGEDYGLEQSQVTVSVTAAGQTTTISFGAENPVTGDLYLQKEGDDSIYTVAYNKAACFQKTKEELFGTFNPAGLTSAAIEKLEYTLLDGSEVSLTAVSQESGTEGETAEYETVWRLTEEPDAELDESKVQGILTALSSYVAGQITDADPADYGFDQPLAAVRATTAEKTVALYYASGTDGCYLMVEGDSSVYRVDIETVNRFSYAKEQLKAQ